MVKKSLKKKSFDSIQRSSGILLHPTSLPGNFGIGELGNEVYKFIDILEQYDLKYWQILPLGPTGYGNSPYQSFSAFAGNPYIISIEKLFDSGLIKRDEISNLPESSSTKIDFGTLIPWKWNVLNIAYQNFNELPDHEFHEFFEQFEKENNFWLHDFALFMAIKIELENLSWDKWPEGLRDRNKEELDNWLNKNNEFYNFQKFVQFLFFHQWKSVKKYCEEKNISIIGDIPIFVAFDSADVWTNRNLFYIDKKGRSELIAGVPPDLFSETGQRWGNPLYKWKEHSKTGYSWWKARIKHAINSVDIIRLDHFRGFEAYWEIDAKEKTAINGKWVKGPGKDFFNNLKRKFHFLPFIAENLGVITNEVEELRNKFNLPGMKILQFGFDDPYNPDNPYLPHNYEQNNVVYTGTHDNETIVGWYNNLSSKQQKSIQIYFNKPINDIASCFIRECFKSVARICIIPLQDVMRINNDGRMNFPGKENNNWEWRFEWNQLLDKYLIELESYSKLFNRSNKV